MDVEVEVDMDVGVDVDDEELEMLDCAPTCEGDDAELVI